MTIHWWRKREVGSEGKEGEGKGEEKEGGRGRREGGRGRRREKEEGGRGRRRKEGGRGRREEEEGNRKQANWSLYFGQLFPPFQTTHPPPPPPPHTHTQMTAMNHSSQQVMMNLMGMSLSLISTLISTLRALISP